MQPLILSLKFDEASFNRLDDLRCAHFPVNRNVLKAHLTLFHALPGEQEMFVRHALTEIWQFRPPMKLRFPGVFSLGKGVAVRVECDELEEWHRSLQGVFSGFLTPQDAQRMRPHVTIQNKVTPREARELLDSLSRSWDEFAGRGVGVSLWRYRGGPWEALGEWPFVSFGDSRDN